MLQLFFLTSTMCHCVLNCQIPLQNAIHIAVHAIKIRRGSKCSAMTLKYGAGQSAPQFETWNKTKAEGIEKQGMKAMTMYLSLLKNEVVDGQLQSLANLNGAMQKCGQCGHPHAKVGGECGKATFEG